MFPSFLLFRQSTTGYTVLGLSWDFLALFHAVLVRSLTLLHTTRFCRGHLFQLNE